MNKKTNTKTVLIKKQTKGKKLFPQKELSLLKESADLAWDQHIKELKSMNFSSIDEALYEIAGRVLKDIKQDDEITEHERKSFVEMLSENEKVNELLRSLFHFTV